MSRVGVRAVTPDELRAWRVAEKGGMNTSNLRPSPTSVTPAPAPEPLSLADVGEFAHQLHDLIGESLATALPEDAVGFLNDLAESVESLCGAIEALGIQKPAAMTKGDCCLSCAYVRRRAATTGESVSKIVRSLKADGYSICD